MEAGEQEEWGDPADKTGTTRLLTGLIGNTGEPAPATPAGAVQDSGGAAEQKG